MKTTLTLIAMATMTLAAFAQTGETFNVAPLTLEQRAQPDSPQPSWHTLRTDALPSTPVGCTVINMMPLIQNGNSMAAVQIFMHNNVTHANYAQLVALTP